MSKDELLTEVLAAHADHLNQGGENTATYLAMFPQYEETLIPLFTLATQLKAMLVPVEPPLAFREELHSELLGTAADSLPISPWRARLSFRPRLPERLLDLPIYFRLPGPPDRQTLMRAAAGGAAGLAAAGVAAYVLHSRWGVRDELEEEIERH
jgi:hypothetical protein